MQLTKSMKRSILSGLKVAEALCHQDWIRQYEFTCWGSSRKTKFWWKLRLTGFSYPCQSRFQGERSPNLHSDRKDWDVVWLLLSLFLLLWNHSEWRLLEVSNNHILKSKTVESWKTTGCELILLQYFPLLHINRIQVMHSAIRKEYVKCWKLWKIRLSCFGKETKETQKIFGKPIGELKLEIKVLKKGHEFLIGLCKSLPQNTMEAREYQGWESKMKFQWSSE